MSYFLGSVQAEFIPIDCEQQQRHNIVDIVNVSVDASVTSIVCSFMIIYVHKLK